MPCHMFYRKYRPQKFSEISKPNDTAESLLQQVKSGKTAHAYLFVGPRGTGKTTTARILAKALNCKKLDKNGDPCAKCESCLAIADGNYMDLIEIDAASNRGIDDIRELRERVKLAPSVGKRKIYIVDEVHMLTNEAFNALLKTLEEPPAHVTFILCTTELHKVPDTIKSRCQVCKFKRATLTQLVDRLTGIAKNEDAKISKEDLKKIANASAGGFRDADTLLQQVIEGGFSVDTLLNVGSKDDYLDFLALINDGDVTGALKKINKIYENGTDLYVWVGEFVKYLRDLLFISVGADTVFGDETEEIANSIKDQAKMLTPLKIGILIESFMKAQNSIKSAFITQLPLELAIVEACSFFDVDDQPTKENPYPKTPLALSTKTARHPEVMTKNVKPISSKKESDPEPEEVSPEAGIIDFKVIEEKWCEVLTKSKDVNSSILALLKAAKVLELKGKSLLLEVNYAFHKERLESSKTRKIVEDTLNEVYGVPLKISCKVSETRPVKTGDREVGMLTDLNVVVPASPDNALNLFDGGLPLR